MTWNVEGHAPIEQEEAIPQLAYAAYRMMDSGRTSVSSRQLFTYFQEARRDLPEVLSYASLSVSDFLKRVEERSSLLILSGYALEEGELREMYEFKHLTFQEYLAAIAIANGYLPANLADSSLVNIIGDRFSSDSWREVVSLTAVLARKGGPIIVGHLIGMLEPKPGEEGEENLVVFHRSREIYLSSLISCLEDEVSIAPPLVQKAITCCIRSQVIEHRLVEACFGGKYEEDVHRIALSGVMQFGVVEFDNFVHECGGILGDLLRARLFAQFSKKGGRIAGWLCNNLLPSSSNEDKVQAASFLMTISYHNKTKIGKSQGIGFTDIIHAVAHSLVKEDLIPSVQFMYIWSMCWAARRVALETSLVVGLQQRLLEIWRNSNEDAMRRVCAWLVLVLPLTSRWEDVRKYPSLIDFLRQELRTERYGREVRRGAALLLGYYSSAFSDEDLLRLVSEDLSVIDPPTQLNSLRKLLIQLGPAGSDLIAQIDKDRAARVTHKRDN